MELLHCSFWSQLGLFLGIEQCIIYIYLNINLKIKLIIMSRYEELKKMIEDYQEDFEKFYNKDNKTAGLRVRKAMQALKVKAQDIRTEVQGIKNKAKS